MKKHLLGLKTTSKEEILFILEEAKKFKSIILGPQKKLDYLKNKTVVTLFYENSTRTKVSFESAAKALSAGTCAIAASSSSIQKGETLIDTGQNLDALLCDCIVIRHSMSGAPHLLSKNVKASVVNGGDGTNEHPTQALLDMLTIYEKHNSFKDLKIVIAGDIKHSRVARSNLWGLTKLGAKVTVVAPNTLLPLEVERMGCEVSNNLDKAVEGANVVMGLRMQLERQSSGLFPSIDEYHKFYGINQRRLNKADSNVMLMHPGPINRGLEIASEVVDGSQSVILPQVTNGIAVRMAVLNMVLGG
ncbi:MAG: aspartate carbamoyltransferase catalytic subunit [Firmicutes bacterium]|nr:aspartate carbamoyltransferase catalytic subunit [Bacillota bacterium]